MYKTYGVLHLADLFRDPTMKYPTMRDWAKVKEIVAGTWPRPVPERLKGNMADMTDQVLDGARFVSVDTEFTNGHMTVMGLANDRDVGWQVGPWWVYRQDEVPHWFRAIATTVPIVFQNAVADLPVIERALGIGYNEYKRIDDTMLAHAVLWSELPHGLEFLASVYGRFEKLKHLSDEDHLLYNWGDVIETTSVWLKLTEEFDQDPTSRSVYEQQSLRLIPLILEQKACGIRTDQDLIREYHKNLTTRKDWAQRTATAYAGWPINLGSDDHLKVMLYDVEGMDKQTKKASKGSAKTGKIVTMDTDAVSKLRSLFLPFDGDDEDKHPPSIEQVEERIEQGGHPLLEARAVYSRAEQLVSQYVEPMKGVGRVFPDVLIHAQASGRWSTNNPPVAQFPEEMLRCLIPDPGEAWITFDWDQIELRLLAHLSNDKPLLEAFQYGWDIHTLNACDIFGFEYPPNRLDPHGDPTPEGVTWRKRYGWEGKADGRRRFAKIFVYRLNYGADPTQSGDIPGAAGYGLVGPVLVAASERYLTAHMGQKVYREGIGELVRTRHTVWTFMGRRRRFMHEGRKAEREALNHPMQGGVVDIFNTTAILIKSTFPHPRLVYSRHDSQTWGTPIEHAPLVAQNCTAIATRPIEVAGQMVSFPISMDPIKVGK